MKLLLVLLYLSGGLLLAGFAQETVQDLEHLVRVSPTFKHVQEEASKFYHSTKEYETRMTERFRDLKSSIEKSSSDYQKKATILQARLEKLDRKLDDRIAAAVEERGKQKTWMVPFVVLAGAVLGLTAFVYTRYRKLAKSHFL
mmetsp:Transcript_11933/g.21259  ORF Transcript_11933/g.21259 Transcript_11933/m.21259 type:complete len:143 (-) Transcript_11933:191-619(-)